MLLSNHVVGLFQGALTAMPSKALPKEWETFGHQRLTVANVENPACSPCQFHTEANSIGQE
jgi:hypothetical protein